MHRLNLIQVAASAVGATVSALIASVFGVKGTIIGVAVGSVAATTATALVWEWIERTHTVVRHVVVENADHLPLLRRGATSSSAGKVTGAAATSSAVDASVDVGGEVENERGTGDEGAGDEGVSHEGVSHEGISDEGGGVRDDGDVRDGGFQTAPLLPVASAETTPSDADDEVRFVTSSRSGSGLGRRRTTPTPPVGTRAKRRRLPIVLTVVAAFVLALGVVTVVELAAGRPLSSLIGATTAPGGTSVGNLVTSTPPSTTTSTTTTTTSPPSTSTTTTKPPTTTTSTTSPTTTSTTTPTSSTTTTTTTTTTPGAPSAPGTSGG